MSKEFSTSYPLTDYSARLLTEHVTLHGHLPTIVPMTDKNFIVGLDIGGTKVEASLFNAPGHELISSLRIPTERDRGYEDVMKRISNQIDELLKTNAVDRQQVKGLGAGLPGSVNPKSLKMINGNSQIFINRDFVGDLKKLSGIDHISIANDANLFALAEFYKGAGLHHAKESNTDFEKLIGVGIILGTGCGGGLCLGGKIHKGAHGGGVEVGHSILKANGRPCYCGRRGCAEQYLSGSSVEKNFMNSKESSAPALRTSEIFCADKNENLSQNTKSLCDRLLKEYKEDLSEFLTNLSAMFDPDFFVLGGGVSTIDAIYTGLEQSLWEKLFVKGSKPKIYKHQIGDSAGALGAALLI